MNLSAVRHTPEYPDVYLKDRNTLAFSIHAQAGDIAACSLICFPRTDDTLQRKIPMKSRICDELQEHFTAVLEAEDTVRYLKYYFELSDREGNLRYCSAWGVFSQKPQDGFFEFLYANETNVLRIPGWSRGQVFYQIFPERFCRLPEEKNEGAKDLQPWGTLPTRENYMGGTLNGILSKVSYLKELGVECLYLNPIFKGDFNHKYATTDYFEIDPAFGTKEDFQNLVEALHQRGIRILLDGVFNHCGVHFFAFQDLLKRQQESEYADWFYIRNFPVTVSEKNAPYECVGDYGFMPKFNTANEKVQEYVLSVMLYWLREFHIDGWRLDVADEVDSLLWLTARQKVKKQFPEALLLGETWGDGLSLMDGKQMDSMMNYVFRDAVRDYIARESIDALHFAGRVCRMLSHYPEEMAQALFLPLDSHDTERFLYLCGEDKRKLKLAVFLQMSFVGAPSVYYGDEVGLTGENDPDCRRCMVWEPENQDLTLRQYYQTLIQIRKREKSIKTGSFAVTLCEGRVFCFVRRSGDEEIQFLCNGGNSRAQLSIPVPLDAVYENLLSGKQILAGSQKKAGLSEPKGFLQLDLEPFEGKMLKKKKNRRS